MSETALRESDRQPLLVHLYLALTAPRAVIGAIDAGVALLGIG
jgi:hypothetical protein